MHCLDISPSRRRHGFVMLFFALLYVQECFRGKAVRAREDVRLAAGSYVRAHTIVKRFPAAQEVQWVSRIIHNHESCIVVDKVMMDGR